MKGYEGLQGMLWILSDLENVGKCHTFASVRGRRLARKIDFQIVDFIICPV